MPALQPVSVVESPLVNQPFDVRTALHADVWHAHALAGAPQQVQATGNAALDAQLPGGGWPVGAMTELLQPAHVQLAALRDKDGHASCCETEAGKPIRIIEQHNPLRRVFERFPRAATMELRMIEQVLGCRVVRHEISASPEVGPHIVFEIL